MERVSDENSNGYKENRNRDTDSFTRRAGRDGEARSDVRPGEFDDRYAPGDQREGRVSRARQGYGFTETDRSSNRGSQSFGFEGSQEYAPRAGRYGGGYYAGRGGPFAGDIEALGEQTNYGYEPSRGVGGTPGRGQLESSAGYFGGSPDHWARIGGGSPISERGRSFDWPEHRGEQRGRFGGVGPKNYRRSRERIIEDVNERLTDDPHIDASHIEVEFEEGNVILRGEVDSRYAKRHAEDIAETVSGVDDVRNELRVMKDRS